MFTTDAAAKSPAETIRTQIGERALFMLGAKDLYSFNAGQGLKFRIRGSKRANLIQVSLASDDTYTVEFWKIRGLDARRLSEHTGVHVGELHSLIERETGLYTSLGTMGRK